MNDIKTFNGSLSVCMASISLTIVHRIDLALGVFRRTEGSEVLSGST